MMPNKGSSRENPQNIAFVQKSPKYFPKLSQVIYMSDRQAWANCAGPDHTAQSILVTHHINILQQIW